MKRAVSTTLALSLAALALGAAAPIAVATPAPAFLPATITWASAPTDQPTQTADLRATLTEPGTPTAAVTITVTGARPGERVEGSVGPIPVTETPDVDQIQAIVNADGQGRAVITLPAPAQGWSARTQYGWVAMALDRGALDRGHFTTPLWPGATEPPAATFRATVQLPKTRTGPVVLTLRGATPGTVEVAFGRSALGHPEHSVSGDAGPDGTAVVRIQPRGEGWRPGERYVWYATSGDLLSTGSVLMPSWNGDGAETTKPRPTKPGTPATPPKESRGGLSKTGA